MTGACGSASGPEIVEYDPAAGTMTTISEPPDSSGQAVNFINLPNGQVLAAAGGRDWIYTPVVYLTNAAGNVCYARSYNFSTMAPSTPGEAESADFILPSGLPHGTYNLFVSACGISSGTSHSFTY